MVRVILLIAAAVALQAQTHVALAARTGVTAEKVTLAHSAANPVSIQACYAVINSTVSGTVTTEVAGTAPTTTALTVSPVSPGGSTGKAVAYGASNVGAGTPTSQPMVLTASVPFVLALKAVRLSGSSTTRNLTVVIALESSGNVTTSIYWAEDGNCEN